MSCALQRLSISLAILLTLSPVNPSQTAAQTATRTQCESIPQYKQFDFWVGEWEVTAEGRKVADSSIQRIVNGCVIYENYMQPDGYLGKSFNFFDSHLVQLLRLPSGQMAADMGGRRR